MGAGKRFAFGVTSLLLMSHLLLWPRRLQEATKCQTARSEPTITQKPGGDLLSRGISPSTIGAGGLNLAVLKQQNPPSESRDRGVMGD